MKPITAGDLIDLRITFQQKGLHYILNRLNFIGRNRIIHTWDHIDHESSDWWTVPAIRKRWNFLITGNHETEYQDNIPRKIK